MLKKIAIITATVIAAAYLVFALFFLNSAPADAKCRGVEIIITDNEPQVLSVESIERQLQHKGLNPKGKPMSKITSGEIEKMLKESSVIAECQCFKTHKNLVGIHIRCKQPIIHIFDNTGGEYYLDNNGAIIKSVQSAIYLPVASGEIKGKETIDNLVKIAQYLKGDRFWREQVEQIYVTAKQEFVIVPRVGNHLIEIGKADNLENKLGKLKEFYMDGLNKVGWNKYKKLNVEFDRQVICTKKD